MNETGQSRSRMWNKPLVWGIGGMVVGMATCGILVVSLMPRLMLVTHESRLGFDETVTAIEQAIVREGWTTSGTTNLNQSMARQGVQLAPQVRIITLCKAEYAKDVLTTDRHVSSLMPCRISVWQGDDGKVYVSKMNTGLMGRLFGGNIARVMGEQVGRDEQAILGGLLR